MVKLNFVDANPNVRPVGQEPTADSISYFTPDFHFSFGSANHRVASDAFIYAGLKALKALRRSTPNG